MVPISKEICPKGVRKQIPQYSGGLYKNYASDIISVNAYGESNFII